MIGHALSASTTQDGYGRIPCTSSCTCRLSCISPCCGRLRKRQTFCPSAVAAHSRMFAANLRASDTVIPMSSPGIQRSPSAANSLSHTSLSYAITLCLLAVQAVSCHIQLLSVYEKVHTVLTTSTCARNGASVRGGGVSRLA